MQRRDIRRKPEGAGHGKTGNHQTTDSGEDDDGDGAEPCRLLFRPGKNADTDRVAHRAPAA